MPKAFAQREGFAKPLPNPSCTSQNCPLEVGHKMKELQERLGRSMGEVEQTPSRASIPLFIGILSNLRERWGVFAKFQKNLVQKQRVFDPFGAYKRPV